MKIIDFIRKNHRTVAFIIFGTPFYIVGATKPDNPPVVVTDGIRLISVVATANDVTLEWETTDERCVGKPFEIERLDPDSQQWTKIADVPAGSTSFVYRRFTVDKTNRWRVSCDITED